MTLLLILAALLPAVVLCIYVFKKDKSEKEPVSFLIKLLFFGVLSCFPTLLAGDVVTELINSFFSERLVSLVDDGVKVQGFYIYNFLYYFLAVALVEEAMKFIVLIFTTRKSKEYNSYFDGLLYAVFVSLGFAAFENVLYVMANGFTTAVLRAVLSVPGHMFFGVMMGYNYSLWHLTEKAAMLEKVFMENGKIHTYKEPFSTTKSKIKCLIVPVLAHGLYDFCCCIGTIWSIIALLAFVIYMYIHCFTRIRKMSNADGPDREYVKYMIVSKYPYLVSEFDVEV